MQKSASEVRWQQIQFFEPPTPSSILIYIHLIMISLSCRQNWRPRKEK
ncbi:hypothetical protein E2C01_003024 [Portunus trituberculatus]|uniref:Uncharacterized protein n=1 Tax=Portunus trituberculatus TaxID=210409 RepID=A0A5B7CLT8_PORTR|nr:hypothetical protein [Portunus trituberculatus]